MHPDLDLVGRRINGILEFLWSNQDDVGEFRGARHFHGSVESYAQPTSYEGWFHFGRCPFFTATIVLHLTGIRDDRAIDMCRRGCSFLSGTFENGLVRYVPARYQDVWFPPDIDDACLAAKVLKDHGFNLLLDENAVLCNADGRGGLYTWFLPRWRHLKRPQRFAWLWRDYSTYARRLLQQDRVNGRRLLHEYRTAMEPAVLANVLLYFGDDRRTRHFVQPLIDFVVESAPTLEYYDSLIGLHFHIGRLFASGERSLSVLARRIIDYIPDRQHPTGCVGNGFDTAMSALTLMYFDEWDHPSLARAVDYLVRDSMHSEGWRPFPYVNPVNRAFSDGCAELTAVLYLDVLNRYRDHMRTRESNQ